MRSALGATAAVGSSCRNVSRSTTAQQVGRPVSVEQLRPDGDPAGIFAGESGHGRRHLTSSSGLAGERSRVRTCPDTNPAQMLRDVVDDVLGIGLVGAGARAAAAPARRRPGRGAQEVDHGIAEDVVAVAGDHVRGAGDVDVLGVRAQSEELLAPPPR